MSGAGFTASVVVRAQPDEVFPCFTGPAGFSRWFVAAGFTTPEEDVELDPRPGGTIAAVMVSTDGSTRIPFRLRFGRIDSPRLVQYVFDDPEETVTIDVRPVADGRTQVNYHKPYGPADDVHAAQAMLDALAAGFSDRAARSD